MTLQGLEIRLPNLIVKIRHKSGNPTSPPITGPAFNLMGYLEPDPVAWLKIPRSKLLGIFPVGNCAILISLLNPTASRGEGTRYAGSTKKVCHGFTCL